MPQQYYFYIFQCKDGSLYSGSTKNLKSRESQHNSGKGSKYVTAHGGGNIVYFEKKKTWSSALKREAEVKAWTREKKLDLIKTNTKF